MGNLLSFLNVSNVPEIKKYSVFEITQVLADEIPRVTLKNTINVLNKIRTNIELKAIDAGDIADALTDFDFQEFPDTEMYFYKNGICVLKIVPNIQIIDEKQDQKKSKHFAIIRINN